MTRARLAVLAAAVLLLAGCSEIPRSGPVQDGSTEGPNDTSIVYIPNPPAVGATQREIVTGFLTAASAGGDFRVARQYLASSFAARWRPRSRVLVQEAQPTITSPSSDELALEVPISGRVDDAGVFTPSNRTVPLDFHLVQQAGQWRIDAAEDGIVLGQTVFQKTYKALPLQFFDPTWTRLVPDLRWFPAPPSGSGAEPRGRIVAALAEGPAGPLAGGIALNALQGADVGGVETTDDVTNVVLNVQGKPTAETVERMQQQLIQSLSLLTPSALHLIVNGQPAPQVKALVNQPTSLSAYVVAGDRFGTMTANGTVAEDRTLGKRIIALQPRAVTVSPRQRIAAVLTGGKQVALVTAGATRVADPRPGLIAPTLDQRDWVYSVPEDDPSGLIAVNTKGQTVDLVADLGGSSVLAIEASPDGTRLLVLVLSSSGPRAFVAGIERATDGTPTGLTDVHYAVDLGGNSGTGSLGATWVDNASVAVLASAPDNSIDRVRVQQLGGVSLSLGQLANATAIVGTSSQSNLRVRLQNGDLWVWTSNLWQSEGTSPVEVSVLAVQR